MSNPSRVASLLDQKLRELERTRRTIEIIEGQVEVLRQLSEGSDAPKETPPTQEKIAVAGPAPKKRARRGAWRAVLIESVRKFPSQFTIDDIVNVSRSTGMEIPRSTVRSQAANYVDDGLLDRIEQGRFRLTEQGRKELGLISNSSPPASDPVVSALPSPPPAVPVPTEEEADDLPF